MTEITSKLSTALADRYKIERRLGEGGMATVYLAEDLKHKRKVAVKVLRPELAAVLGAERFVQEITTTANLQHPHILPLFDSGEADSFLYYVMPFIDGETLRDKLNRETQLGIEEAVKITTDIAGALHYAHGEGVIHRDIKPENILIHNGRPMVADFGIALAVSAAAGGRMTETGLSLGTPHYMSPEQATAEKDLTARSDIYSLASVLYEMLTGSPPHVGSSAQQIIMKIVAEDVQPVNELRKLVPPNVAAATAKALEKLPADRFASASALADALSDPAFATADVQAGFGRAPTAPPTFLRRTMAAVLTAVVLGLAAGWLVRGPPPAVSLEVTRFTLQLPGLNLTAMPAFSPDGARLAYLTQSDSSADLNTLRTAAASMSLVVRRLDRFEPELVVTTLGGMPRWINPPFFSPDGQWVGYVTADGLEKVRLDGDGTPIRIAVDPPLGAALGASWGSGDYIVFTPDVGLGLSRVSASGGPAETLTEVDRGKGETVHAWPHVLPDGRAVIYSRLTSEGFTTAVYAMDRRESIDLFSSAAPVQYVSSGHLVFASGGSVSAVAFEAEQLRIAGQPFPVLADLYVSQFAGADLGWFAASRNGSLAVVRREAIAHRGLTLVNRDGSTDQELAGVSGLGPRFSPDGRFVAYTEGFHTWIYDLAAGTADPLVTGPANFVPMWSPGGEQIALGSYASGPSNLVVVSIGTDAPPTPLLERDFRQYPQSWSPDGRFLAYIEAHPTTGSDIWTLDVQSGEATPVLATDFVEAGPEFSPNGRWLAYTSNRTGRFEVYVQGFPEPGRPMRVSVEGGADPIWRTDGKELFFRRGDEFWVVAARPGTNLTFDPPRLLFTYPAAPYSLGSYDVSPDGQRFIVSPRVPVVDRLEVVRNGLWEFLGDEDSRRD